MNQARIAKENNFISKVRLITEVDKNSTFDMTDAPHCQSYETV
jgi:hypothetical protein